MSKKATTITMVIVALVTLAIIVTVVICAVKSGKQPEKPVGPSTDITSPTKKPDDPVNPPIEPEQGTDNDKDKTEEKNPNMGDVNIYVEQPVDENRNDNPCIDGDVAIIPGVKGEDE